MTGEDEKNYRKKPETILERRKVRINIMYYRVAIQTHNECGWKWKSTPLASLEALFRFLRLYNAISQDRLRVFKSSSREEMDAMLAQENNDQASFSVTAEQFLRERRINSWGVKQEGTTDRTQEPRRTRTGTLTPPPRLTESGTQEPFLKEQNTSALERRRVELEMGAGGDHDLPYTFALPASIPQVLSWTRLMVRVQHGELHP
jgi:hypothetical protein